MATSEVSRNHLFCWINEGEQNVKVLLQKKFWFPFLSLISHCPISFACCKTWRICDRKNWKKSLIFLTYILVLFNLIDLLEKRDPPLADRALDLLFCGI